MTNKYLYIFVLLLMSNWTLAQCLSSNFIASAVKMEKPEIIRKLIREDWQLSYSNESENVNVNGVKFNAELSRWKSQVGELNIYFLETDYENNVVMIMDIDDFCRDELDALPSTVNVELGRTIRLCDQALLTYIDANQKKILKEQEIAERKKREEQLKLIAEEKERQRRIELQAKMLEEDKSNLNAEIAEKFQEKSYKYILDRLNGLKGSNLLNSAKYKEYYTNALEGYFEQVVVISDNLVKEEKIQDALGLWRDLSNNYELSHILIQKINGQLSEIKRIDEFLQERPLKIYAADRFNLKRELDEVMSNEILRYNDFNSLVDDFEVVIHWSSDYKGVNNSSIQITPINPLGSLIENRLSGMDLPTIDGYNINIKQTFTYQFSPSQNYVECKYGDSFAFSNSHGSEENKIRNWLYGKPKGKYLFDVKKIRMNSAEIYSIGFEKYEDPRIKVKRRTSFLHPVYGKDLLSRVFQVAAIGGVLFEIISQDFYEDYLNDPTNGDLYQQANDYHQASLITAGVAALNYVTIVVIIDGRVKEMKKKEKVTNEIYQKIHFTRTVTR
jgi:hypothetical protein